MLKSCIACDSKRKFGKMKISIISMLQLEEVQR